MSHWKRLIFFLFIAVLLFNNVLFSQEKADKEQIESVSSTEVSRASIAMNAGNYIVTAGDVYALNFLANGTPVTFRVIVDSSYRMRVANLAILNVENMNFVTLKKQVEEIVSKNYPMSGVQFSLVSPGSFYVVIKGEVNEAKEVPAWALTRLSSVVSGNKTNYSSIRNIKIRSEDDSVRTYDLFKAKRFGDLSQDPYVRPGDVITIPKADRLVSVSGAVHRPGYYELLPNENLYDLINVYGSGLTPSADTSRIEITKITDSKNKTGKKVYLNGIDKKYALTCYDSVHIPSYSDLKPIVFVEGAILIPEAISDEKGDKSEQEKAASSPLEEAQRTSVRFEEGLNYASFIRSHEEWFTSSKADIDNAYIIRGEERIGIDLRKILYDYSYYSDLTVEPDDTLFVPFKQSYVVIVEGEVNGCGEVPVSALTRLSSVYNNIKTSFSSSRNIKIKSVDGNVKQCDLYKANREGDLSENPYLKPGDVITVGRIERLVTISGAVERPGTYELLPGENLVELVNKYGHGLVPTADTSRIEITKVLNTKNKTGEKQYLNKVDENFKLNCYDSVHISSYRDLKPIVFVEGAILIPEAISDEKGDKSEQEKAASSPLEESQRTSVRFEEGLNYASFVRSHEEWFTSSKADIDDAYIIRGEERIEIDLRKILYDYSYYSDLTVEPNDTLFVPFKQSYVVIVEGEVNNCGEVPVGALTRLSTVYNSIKTSYSSSRDLKVKSVDGNVKQCDLYKATREGDLSENPYLKPGDIITVDRIERLVTISGSVERPGTYELLPGENLVELINKYGHGLTTMADTSRIEVTKLLSSKSKTGEKLYLDKVDEAFQLNCYDSVSIASYNDLKPIVFIEGAVGNTASDTELTGSKKVSVRFEEGLNYATFVRSQESLFSAKSDLKNAYIIRDNERINIDLTKILYDSSYRSDLFVQPYDTLLIPFKQLYINVAGAVALPGRYPYIPDRTYEYYIGAAGGFVADKNVGGAVEIVDTNGNKLDKKDFIQPETTITAKTNSFTYYFAKYAPLISTALSLITTTISLGMMFK